MQSCSWLHSTDLWLHGYVDGHAVDPQNKLRSKQHFMEMQYNTIESIRNLMAVCYLTLKPNYYGLKCDHSINSNAHARARFQVF